MVQKSIDWTPSKNETDGLRAFAEQKCRSTPENISSLQADFWKAIAFAHSGVCPLFKVLAPHWP